jgi:hypothetical protein
MAICKKCGVAHDVEEAGGHDLIEAQKVLLCECREHPDDEFCAQVLANERLANGKMGLMLSQYKGRISAHITFDYSDGHKESFIISREELERIVIKGLSAGYTIDKQGRERVPHVRMND